MNNKNKKLFEEFMVKHLEEGGKAPREYAITELIKISIENKDYKVYKNQRVYTYGTTVNNFDVLVHFYSSGVATFYVCMNNSEGAFCSLYTCKEDGKLYKEEF